MFATIPICVACVLEKSCKLPFSKSQSWTCRNGSMGSYSCVIERPCIILVLLMFAPGILGYISFTGWVMLPHFLHSFTSLLKISLVILWMWLKLMLVVSLSLILSTLLSMELLIYSLVHTHMKKMVLLSESTHTSWDGAYSHETSFSANAILEWCLLYFCVSD